MTPSRIPNAQLCFETLTGEIDWKLPGTGIPVQDITPRRPRASLASHND